MRVPTVLSRVPSLPRPRRDAWTAAVVWGVAAYLVHAVGNHTGLYFEYGWYQNLTHACSASAMAALVAGGDRERRRGGGPGRSDG